ncbi:occludin/ELL domain-containing protein 1 [Acomys russatus]|uniref:occludin/ELL domain-containing protein 1 n=1 Tax=Acomys russatus TaxID=60746 RepID=UPI0021E23AC2|nr:occludin/ELL domain-containing protein 1 [Acomys russatus]
MQIPTSPASRRGAPAGRSRRPGATCSSRPAAGGRPSAAALRMPARERAQPHPPGPKPRARPPQCQPGSWEHRRRTRRIVFADELRTQASLQPDRPPGDLVPCSNPVPDYELKYPPVRSGRERSRYAAVFQDQFSEFSELQREVEAAQARLGQLEALLLSLPRPRTQKEAHLAVRVRREFEKKRSDPGFLDKEARCRYLKGKLRHLKAQIRKFDDQGDSSSEESVYF